LGKLVFFVLSVPRTRPAFLVNCRFSIQRHIRDDVLPWLSRENGVKTPKCETLPTQNNPPGLLIGLLFSFTPSLDSCLPSTLEVRALGGPSVASNTSHHAELQYGSFFNSTLKFVIVKSLLCSSQICHFCGLCRSFLSPTQVSRKHRIIFLFKS